MQKTTIRSDSELSDENRAERMYQSLKRIGAERLHCNRESLIKTDRVQSVEYRVD